MVLVIADDLTGGNATGVMMVKQGLRAYTVMTDTYGTGSFSYAEEPNGPAELNGKAPGASSYSGVIIPTDSRGLEPEDAYSRVREAVTRFAASGVSRYGKRIDSTLRGNIGYEVDAVFDALGAEYTAIIVPAFPRAGRVQTSGRILLNGVPLSQTSAAKDPKNPVTVDSISELLEVQSRYPYASVFSDELARGEEYLSDRIKTLRAENTRAIIFDAASDEDIKLIARAALRSRVKFFSVDPGPFTAALAGMTEKPRYAVERAHEMPDKQHGEIFSTNRVLAAIGSVNGMASAQAAELLTSGNVFNVYIETSALLESENSREEEIARAAGEIIRNGKDYSVCCVTASGILPGRRVDFAPYMKRLNKTAEEISALVNAGIGETVRRVLDASEGETVKCAPEGDISDGIVPAGSRAGFTGLFTCGGDITAAVCQSLGAKGIALEDEVIPLASFGRLAGGNYNGMKIVTKGGMVGGSDAMKLCVNYLLKGDV